jgi:hypothetical protein
MSTIKRRNRARELALSEIMTILILFHQSHYREVHPSDWRRYWPIKPRPVKRTSVRDSP